MARHGEGNSDNVDGHTRTDSLRIHYAELDKNNAFKHPDRWVDCQDEPGHLALCLSEQRYFVQAITEQFSLEQHLQDALNSLRIVLAADEAVRTQRTVILGSES